MSITAKTKNRQFSTRLRGKKKSTSSSPFPFVFTVAVTAGSLSFTIPCQNVGVFNAQIDWGDGSAKSTVTTYNSANLAHTYAAAGSYTIKVRGTFPNIYFNNVGDKLKVTSVTQLGIVGWTRLNSAFYGCSNMTSFVSGATNTAAVTTMASMLSGCSALTSLNVSSFNTSAVTSTYVMFSNCIALTSLDVSSFNTAAVTTMAYMFSGCSALTSLNVSSLNTSAVTTMAYMFGSCSALTSLNVSSFNTAAVTTMQNMFNNCFALANLNVSSFNLSHLNVSTALTNFATGSKMTTAQYDATLINWNAQTPFAGLSPNFGLAKYSTASAAARANLISARSWVITDGGPA